MSNPENSGDTRSSFFIAIYSAVGIGLMVGVILGMSVSPIAAMFVGAVGAALAVLLGLNDESFTTAKGLRVGTFGIAVIVGLWGGLTVRTHNLAGISVLEQKNQYLEAGFSEREALDMIKTHQAAVFDSTVDSVSVVSSVLFSGETTQTECDEVSSPHDNSLSTEAFLGNFRLAGRNWESLADAADELSGANNQKFFATAIRDAFCGPPLLKLEDSDCRKLVAESRSNETGSLWNASDSSVLLQSIFDRITTQIDTEYQATAKSLAVEYLKGICVGADK